MNGLIFTGSRVYSSLGKEHRVFALLGRWHPTLGAPIWSLLIQAGITLVMISWWGPGRGGDGIDAVLKAIGQEPIPWGRYFGGFNTLFAGSAPVFWIFLPVDWPGVFRPPFQGPEHFPALQVELPWFPLLPLIFCGMCVFGFYSAYDYAKWISLIGFIPLALGIPVVPVFHAETARS